MLTPEMHARDNTADAVVAPLGIDNETLDAYLAGAGISRNAFLQTVALLTMASMEKAENVMQGWVFHGRDSRKKDRSIGLLIKEIPMGLALGELTDVASMYASVRSQMSMGLAHRDYPYTMLNASAALNDVFCVIDEGDLMDAKGLASIPGETIPLPKAGTLGWLMTLVFFNQGGIFLGLYYTVNRYQRSTMERFCAEYQRIAAALAGSELTTPVKDLLAR